MGEENVVFAGFLLKIKDGNAGPLSADRQGEKIVKRMKRLLLLIAFCLVVYPAVAQQVGDPNFKFEHKNPPYAQGEGPRVCIDEAHHNFHTAGGRYKPFADLLRGDGYTIEPFAETFTQETLAPCRVLVIANALAEANQNNWNYPHPSAFTGDEMRELMLWVRGGGKLLLFADHAPFPGAAASLGAVFAVVMLDVYADAIPGVPDDFRLDNGTLQPHPILEGRDTTEKIDSVRTFTGQAFQITDSWKSLLVFGENAFARIPLGQGFQPGPGNQWPRFSVAGWSHGAAREWEKGRVVFLGEAAMCSAQVSGANKTPMGMNHPGAKQNPQFCLNVVHWLDGLLE